jgi:amino acid permease
MKQFKYVGVWMIAIALSLSSCELIVDIFQAGMAVGIFVVVLIVALVIWLISRFRR